MKWRQAIYLTKKKKKKFKDDLITQRRMDEQRENLKKELEEANRAGKNNT